MSAWEAIPDEQRNAVWLFVGQAAQELSFLAVEARLQGQLPKAFLWVASCKSLASILMRGSIIRNQQCPLFSLESYKP